MRFRICRNGLGEFWVEAEHVMTGWVAQRVQIPGEISHELKFTSLESAEEWIQKRILEIKKLEIEVELRGKISVVKVIED